MFKIDCFCDDRNLARVHHALAGIVLDLKAVPVVNAKAGRNGKVTAETNGGTLSLLAEWLKKEQATNVRASDIKAFATSHGKSEKSYSSILKTGTNAGLLKRLARAPRLDTTSSRRCSKKS
jgi:hypothetical protein